MENKNKEYYENFKIKHNEKLKEKKMVLRKLEKHLNSQKDNIILIFKIKNI